jgi:hypothetical protein
MPNSLEEITAHSPLPSVPFQASNALVRRLLARVEVLAVRLAVSSLSTIYSPSTERGSIIVCVGAMRERRVWRDAAVGGRTFRISWPWDLPTRACRFRRACLWALCLREG